MKREDIINCLNKLMKGQFSVQDGGSLIIEYIFEKKGIRVQSFSVSQFEYELYDSATKTALEYFEKKFNIVKVFINNKVVLIS